MKCQKGKRVLVIITIVPLLVMMLTTTGLHIKKCGGFACTVSYFSTATANNYTMVEEGKPSKILNVQHNNATMIDRSLHNIKESSWKNTSLQLAKHWTPITLPVTCVEKNCRESLSKQKRAAMHRCEREVRTKEKYNGHINDSDCRFLLEMSRHPVALISARGSGNTWTRGLLERATGICTGFLNCDKIMRAHGFVGENIKSGKVLVVKTHSVVPRWIGENNTYNEFEPSYSSAVFILRNPVKSAIAEWNQRASQKILGKNNSAIAHQRHTYTVPVDLFSKLSV